MRDLSQTKAIELHDPFKDGRSVAAKRYQIADKCTKPEMAESMIKRALNLGYQADYLFDGWFGTKAMICLTEETALIPVFRMKKNTLKYRISEWVGGETVTLELDAQTLYKRCIRKNWQPIHGRKYQAKTLDVELNLAQTKDF